MLSARWTEANDTGALPPGLTGHVAAVWRSSLYIHGGIAQDGRARGELYELDLDSRRWRVPVIDGVRARPRKEHACAVLGDRMFLFGGSGDGGFSLMRSMPVLDLRTRVWSRPAVFGKLPPAVSGHSLTALGSTLVLLGGRIGQMNCQPDVFQLDTITMSWTHHRMVAGATTESGAEGGTEGGSEESSALRRIAMAALAPSPSERMHHVAVSAGGGVLMFGGAVLGEAGAEPTDELWLLHAVRRDRPEIGPRSARDRTVVISCQHYSRTKTTPTAARSAGHVQRRTGRAPPR